MHTLFDIVFQTFRTLWAHKLRSFLTMFGIAWGVGSLLLLVGLGEGFRSGNQKELNTMGEMITLNGIRFQVVGYLDTVGQNEGNATNQRLYIPFSTMEELFPVVGENYPEGTLSFINYKPLDRASHAQAVAQVKHILARNH